MSLAVFAGELMPAAEVPPYDPLAISAGSIGLGIDLVVKDSSRQRDLPIRVFLPSAKAAAAVLIFSPGLGGSRENYAYLANHWGSHGYAVVVLQHPGSDDAVWKGKPASERLVGMRNAASLENFALRAKDVPAVIDQLANWNGEANQPLYHRLDLQRMGMGGHSFGAVTSQAVAGQTYRGGQALYTDERIKAALLLSPSPPRIGDVTVAFGSVKIPWLLITGTRDNSPIGDIDARARLTVFPALPPNSKYELVLDGAEHSAFSDRPLPAESGTRNPNHQRVILAISTAFFDAYLREDAAARLWLDGAGPRTLLEKQDRWQAK